MTTPRGPSRSRTSRRMFGVLAAWIVATSAAPSSAADRALPPPGEYVVDPVGSSVGFGVVELLINNVHGKFTTFDAKVVIGDAIAASRVEASVDVASIDTGVKMRDEHLRRADYFDAATYPRMTFASTALWGAADNFGMKGNLTIKGVTREVVFTGKILDGGLVQADAQIDRTAFGITAGSTIKNEVQLHLRIHLARKPGT